MSETPAAYGAAHPPADMATQSADEILHTIDLCRSADFIAMAADAYYSEHRPKELPELNRHAKVMGELIRTYEAQTTELAAARERIAALEVIVRKVAGMSALTSQHGFNCYFCGKQPFQQFELGIIEAGWEHATDCPIPQARALLADVAHHNGEGESNA